LPLREETRLTPPLPTQASGPLTGVTIIDMTSVIFGSYATQMLGDLGADVIKVESPAAEGGDGGDITRWTGDPPAGGAPDIGPIFMTINRNKRSIVLDLRKESARRAIRRLIAKADVFCTTVRYDGMRRLGLGYDDVAAIKPDIVYVHGSGFGADGPYAGLPAYDDLIQASTGIADLLSRVDNDPTPRYMPTVIGDKVCALFMVQATTAALFHRARTGEGQFVEVPMYECMTSFNLAEHLYGHVFDPPTGPYSYVRLTNPHRRPFPTKDGHIGLLPYTDKQWVQFFEAAGRADDLKDPRFSDYRARTQNASDLYALVNQITPLRSSDEWLALLRPLHIPVIKINRLDDLMDDAHLKAVNFFERMVHPQSGAYFSMKPPLRFSKTPANIRRHAPRLGEHNRELLRDDELD